MGRSRKKLSRSQQLTDLIHASDATPPPPSVSSMDENEIQARLNFLWNRNKGSYSLAQGDTTIGAIALNLVWDVEANESYDVSVGVAKTHSAELRNRGGTGLIALRTLAGTGRVYLDSGIVIETLPETLLIIEWAHLERYHCVGSVWRFWWFEFELMGPGHFLTHRLMNTPIHPEDSNNFKELYLLLKRHAPTQRRLASILFILMLYRWIAGCEEEFNETIQRKAILKVIDLMYEKLTATWTVSEMAKSVHMSQRTFRRAFHAETGQAPKPFYDRLRLTLARELLQLKLYTISEVAAHFDFSSASHFSLAFRRQFGFAPSSINRR